MMLHKRIIYPTIYVVAFVALAMTGYAVGDFGVKRVHNKNPLDTKFITDISYFDLPRMSVYIPATDLTTSKSHVNIDLSLEVEGRNLARLKDYQPRITDRLTTFINQQNANDMKDTTSQIAFRNSLLVEANKASYPVPIMDIVFRRLLFM